jgi:copper(I)-binding protein
VEIDADGVARMHEVDALDIPAGATVTLAPSGLHVMFMGLDAPLVAGASIPATLVFENAGELAVEFKVEPRSAGGDTHDAMPGMAH